MGALVIGSAGNWTLLWFGMDALAIGRARIEHGHYFSLGKDDLVIRESDALTNEHYYCLGMDALVNGRDYGLDMDAARDDQAD